MEKRGPQSPIDRAYGHEVVWPQVSRLFAAARRISNPSFIYVIGEGVDGPVKIGLAKDPIKRLRGMQTGNSRRLKIEYVLLGERGAERLLHEAWEPHALRSAVKEGKVDTPPGTEWFKAEVRDDLFDVLETAAEWQVEHVLLGDEKSFDELTKIIYEAHLERGVVPHERDEVRLPAAGGGYLVQRPSMVRHFARQ